MIAIAATPKYRDAVRAFGYTFLGIIAWAMIMMAGPFLHGSLKDYPFLAVPFLIFPAIPLLSIVLYFGGAYIFLVSKEERTTVFGKNIMLFPARLMGFLFSLALSIALVIGIMGFVE